MNAIPEIKSPMKEKVVVKPILWTMYHIHAYQGPCRYGQGYALTTECDMEVGQKEFQRFQERIAEAVDMGKAEILEPELLHWNEDFIIREEVWEKALAEDNKVDLYLICGLRIAGYFTVELAKRTSKAIAFIPNESAHSKCDQVDMSAHLLALGRKEVYSCIDMSDVVKAIDILRVKKIMKNLKIFFPLKSAQLTFGCQSSYLTLDHVKDRFGVNFSHINAQEVFQVIDEMSDEEKAVCAELADQLVKDAKGVHMPAEYVKNDMEFYMAIKKLMALHECNAFTIPCFEVCATRELNKRKFTFCLAKSMLKEEGLPAACAGDVCSVLTTALLMAVANAAPYMGNTMVWDRENNECRILHDVPTRYMKGFDKGAMLVELVSFAMDGWGTTLRYDFAQDIGETVTLINMSPDMKKIMIVTGKITGCDNYLVPECKLAMRFKVADANHFHECQKWVGHHFSMVYGDYAQQIAAVAADYGMEVLQA